MAGIYFHIPFCRQACHYCDFHFSTSLRLKQRMLAAMRRELQLQKDFFNPAKISTIYFGGGTPSICTVGELEALIQTVDALFSLASDAEITVEANPDDLTTDKLKAYQNSSVNRLSIGIQSFFDEDLQWMNRAHTAAQADAAIANALSIGFDNLTADLIYGFPLLSNDKWEANLRKVFNFGIPHLSAYSMTVEEKTALASFIQQGRQTPMSDPQSAEQFQLLCVLAAASGYEQYEISNFARAGRYARHNSNYWKSVPYLGIGPSAHSFDGTNRQWNIKNNARYLQYIEDDRIPSETEQLTETDRLNEVIMTRLRTRWGVDLEEIEGKYGMLRANRLYQRLQPFVADASVLREGHRYLLTSKGKLFADAIAAALFETKK